MGPVLYSTNPWFATDVAMRYRHGSHFAWVCEYFDSKKAPAGSAAALTAPSSNPRRIYNQLREDCEIEDKHSALIGGYKKTFSRLAKQWLADGSLAKDQYDEILAITKDFSWNIWRPVLYVIPRTAVEPRIKSVNIALRAGYGPELQIEDLQPHEFDIIELAT
jgi:hypothetical protein